MFKSKKYSNVFAQAAKHPQAGQFLRESKVKINLNIALYQAGLDVDFSELNKEEKINFLVNNPAFDFLKDEPDLYNDLIDS